MGFNPKKVVVIGINALAAMVGAGALALFMLPAYHSVAYLQPSEVLGERLASRHAVMAMRKSGPEAGCGLLRSADQKRAWHAAIDEARIKLSLPKVEHPVVDEAAIRQTYASLGCEYPKEINR